MLYGLPVELFDYWGNIQIPFYCVPCSLVKSWPHLCLGLTLLKADPSGLLHGF